MIVASNLADQDDYTTFDVDSAGHLEPATYGTNGQVIRSMALNKDSTLLIFGREANGTTDMFGRDLKTNKRRQTSPRRTILRPKYGHVIFH